jgi:Arc/MetJ family transcription regulator
MTTRGEEGADPPTGWCIVVYGGVMGRTNLELDDALVAEAMRRYGLPSKRAAVDLALRRLVGEAATVEEALAMEGSGWLGDLDDVRSDGAAHLA